MDPVQLLPGLAAAFHQDHHSGVVNGPKRAICVDVGAHHGEFVARMLQLFSDLESRRYHLSQRASTRFKSRFRDLVGVLAFEPNPNTFAALASRHRMQGWGDFGVCALQAALGNETGRQMSFHALDDDDSEASTLEQDHVSGHELARLPHRRLKLDVASLDAWLLDGYREPSTMAAGAGSSSCSLLDARRSVLDLSDDASALADQIFLLKIDAQGHDDQVLRGAHKLMAAGKVRFLIFEYEYAGQPRDLDAPRALGSTVQYLWKFNMVCFLVLHRILIPISDKYWTSAYDIASRHPRAQQSDVICGEVHDEGLALLIRSFGTSPVAPRAAEFALFALESLRADSLRMKVLTEWRHFAWSPAEVNHIEMIVNASAQPWARGEAMFLQVVDCLLR
mmetsp:Transcript_30607/g.97514  ORF Transcript_30607/g.97514 Transcript_30607/m.97514 type:complete len:393 (-) Transcript_30607:155-1333(-)